MSCTFSDFIYRNTHKFRASWILTLILKLEKWLVLGHRVVGTSHARPHDVCGRRLSLCTCLTLRQEYPSIVITSSACGLGINQWNSFSLKEVYVSCISFWSKIVDRPIFDLFDWVVLCPRRLTFPSRCWPSPTLRCHRHPSFIKIPFTDSSRIPWN